MRALALLPLLLVAACTETAEADQKADKSNLKLEAGQWALATEIIGIDALDKSPKAALPGKVGDKAEDAACINAAEIEKPQPALFAGEDIGECTYESLYLSRGRLNGTLGCKKKGLDGNIQVSLEGSYTATTMDVSARTQTYLSGEGDVAMTRKITGKKVAATCAPEAPEEAPKG